MPGTVPRLEMMPTYYNCGKDDSKVLCEYECNGLLNSAPHWRLPNGRWSGGGPFYVIKRKLTTTGRHPIDWVSSGVPWQGTTGPVLPYGNATGPPAWATVLQQNPSYGQQGTINAGRFAKGWAQTRPGNPTANLGQFLVELRDLPTLPGRSFLKSVDFRRIGREAHKRAGLFSSLGSEYLNIKFGWEPFVRDLQDIYRLMKNIDKQIAQIKRDNGRGIRRSGQVEQSNDSVTTTTNTNVPFSNVLYAPPGFTTGRSTHTLTTTTSVKSWFSACYMYYIRDTSDWKWDARARAALFGVLPTPSVVYEVLPWSWMVDWFANVGDVMSNVSPNAVDNLVAQYSFIMTTTETKSVASCSTSWDGKHFTVGGVTTKIDAGSASLTTTLTNTTKVRVGGSPLGFGVSFNSLSTGQKGILAALGISRTRF